MFNKKPFKVLVSIFAAYGAFHTSMTVILMIRKIRFKHLSPEKKFEFILSRPHMKDVVDETKRTIEDMVIQPLILSPKSNSEIINEYNDYILEVGPTVLPNILSAAGVDNDEDVSYFTTRIMSMVFPDIKDYLPRVS